MPLLQLNASAVILFLSLQLPVRYVVAQEEKVATIQLNFTETDSTKVCKATVMSDGKPVAGPEVHLYVQRMYSLLPVGKVVATDETGVANIDFPMDLPGGKDRMLIIIAKIEKDETYGDVESQSAVKWGSLTNKEASHWSDRSLSASREKAPMFLVIASVSIILVIWGTIFYIIFQLAVIKKSGREVKKVLTIVR